MTPDHPDADAARQLLNGTFSAYLVVEADYSPHDAIEAPGWARRLIGCRCQWFGRWRIEAGPYAGQWAMVPVYRGARQSGADDGARWVPLAHLRQIRVIGCPAGVRGERARRASQVA